MGKRCYIACANTSSGVVSYFDYILRDADRVYILKGGPGCGKSTFMKRIGYELLNEGCNVDFVYSSSDVNSLDAVVIKDINVVIIDGNMPHMIDPKYPGAVERILDFGDYWDIDYLRANKECIKQYIDRLDKEYKELFAILGRAKLIHDRWEKEYLIGMDFDKAEEITNNLIHDIIKENIDNNGKELHRFSGAMMPQGNINFYENLTEDIKNRYIIKGRPGTGKSTMSKKVAKAALDAGYDVEYYHCAFDPESIDMVIIPDLSFAMLDGTAPHVFDPDRGDRVVDMFACIDTTIVHEEESPIKDIEKEYGEEIEKAREVYKNIKKLHDELESFYINATDFNNVNALRIRITKTLKEMLK